MASNDSAQFQYAKDLDGLELLRARYQKQTFSRHVHEGYCVGVIQTGAQCFYRSGGNHIAPRNSIIMVNADQVHDGYSADRETGWSYSAMYPVPEMFEQASRELERTGAPYFPEPVVHDPVMAQQLLEMFHILEQSENSLERQTSYLATMISLLQRHGQQNPAALRQGQEPLAAVRVREYLDAHFNENVTLDELAQLVGLTPFYLARCFQRTFGLPPHAYQVQRRIMHARRLIRLGVPLIDVADSCGFTDQSHLNRHFKKNMGITPGQYRRQCA